ncbi:hypothetical protein KAFR_0F01680 [Kazachstania africana CBS 2517]|uniref:Uncharacterized protein n=1 Tax=Kazachstania africana (strain ATCC 22294 / BCRC 22015 / CBS 2517 / CECT 1963 / NBRC 1671 / NRRL Y-8276) TaxID=1071382 RepID=H2AWL5_KAZAF|nr:hypothetical protein KAFR_0F01680 [Kazachstania africana CBS 2517]CCF58765.1 hypothetical protein KAFR_0F01680 [Kazachstania africana CBS 2517]
MLFYTPTILKFALPRCSRRLSRDCLPIGTRFNSTSSQNKFLDKPGRKLWKHVSVNDTISQEKFHIQLDGKTIKTPLGNPLAVGKDRDALAYLLMKEWDNLKNLSSKRNSLPLTSLVSRCIDLEVATNEKSSGPDAAAKIGGGKEVIKNDLLRYLDTDTLLVFSPRSEYEGALREEQDSLYLPIIKKIESFLSENFGSSPITLQILDADRHGLRGNVQNPETRKAAMKYLDSLCLWNLVVFENVVLTTKSFICGILLLQDRAFSNSPPDLHYSIEEIERAATLETIHQTRRWGEVEEAHAISKAELRMNLYTASVVAFKE